MEAAIQRTEAAALPGETQAQRAFARLGPNR